MGTAFQNYPVRIRIRTRFYNLFRYFFKISLLESFLLYKILYKPRNIFYKFIPPLYLYKPGSMRLVERNNLKYALDISRLLDHSIFFGVVNEPSWINLFKNLKSNSVVLDTGANIGYLSLHFAHVCPQGFVFSFEPDSENYRDLERNVQLNGFQNIKTFPLALGARSEKAILFKIHPRNPGANRILPIEPPHQSRWEWVEVNTLDEIVEEIGISKIDLWKIDVEGYEMFVLLGGSASIRKWKPTLFVELVEENLREQGYTALSLIEHIENLGYEVLDAKTMQAVERFKPDHHTDIICFSKSA